MSSEALAVWTGQWKVGFSNPTPEDVKIFAEGARGADVVAVLHMEAPDGEASLVQLIKSHVLPEYTVLLDLRTKGLNTKKALKGKKVIKQVNFGLLVKNADACQVTDARVIRSPLKYGSTKVAYIAKVTAPRLDATVTTSSGGVEKTDWKESTVGIVGINCEAWEEERGPQVEEMLRVLDTMYPMDSVLIFGDFNYRLRPFPEIEYGEQTTNKKGRLKGTITEAASRRFARILASDMPSLLALDSLTGTAESGASPAVLAQRFHIPPPLTVVEGAVAALPFLPSYKVTPGAADKLAAAMDQSLSVDERAEAFWHGYFGAEDDEKDAQFGVKEGCMQQGWLDRVGWERAEGKVEPKLVAYASLPRLCLSDHLPVAALFSLDV